MLNIHFVKLTEPAIEIAQAFSRWENDPGLIPFLRPNRNQDDLEKRRCVTLADLRSRLTSQQTYLIYLEGQLIGEMDVQLNPGHLFRKDTPTAWIGICIGEKIGRGKGVGYLALQYLEQQVKRQGLKRIELGVFEFNTNAIKLYQRSGYLEIGRIQDFTYWQGQMRQDIRMEKLI